MVETDHLRNELEEAKQKNAANDQTLEKERNDCLTKLELTSKTLTRRIEALRKKGYIDIDDQYKHLKQELHAESIALSTAVETVDKYKQVISASGSLSETQTFVLVKMGKDTLSNIAADMPQQGHTALVYNDNDELTGQIMKAAFLMNIEEQKEIERIKPMTKRSKKKVRS